MPVVDLRLACSNMWCQKSTIFSSSGRWVQHGMKPRSHPHARRYGFQNAGGSAGTRTGRRVRLSAATALRPSLAAPAPLGPLTSRLAPASASHQVSHQRNILTSHDSTSYHKMFDATRNSLSAFSNGLPRSIRMAKLYQPVVSVNDRVNSQRHVLRTSCLPLPALSAIASQTL